MKLSKSKTLLTSTLRLIDFTKPNVKTYIEDLKVNPKIKNYKIAFVYMVWNSLNKEIRDNIISNSIPFESWIGGYADYKDQHLQTLLRSVMNNDFFDKIENS
jgi:flagellar biosynthesis regulator FlaF